MSSGYPTISGLAVPRHCPPPPPLWHAVPGKPCVPPRPPLQTRPPNRCKHQWTDSFRSVLPPIFPRRHWSVAAASRSGLDPPGGLPLKRIRGDPHNKADRRCRDLMATYSDGTHSNRRDFGGGAKKHGANATVVSEARKRRTLGLLTAMMILGSTLDPSSPFAARRKANSELLESSPSRYQKTLPQKFPRPLSGWESRVLNEKSQGSQLVEVPMYPCQGSYCIEYELEGKSFRGVLDTGSPFLILDGTACSSRWGCYKGQGESAGLEDTYERYASQEGNVAWKRGRLKVGKEDMEKKHIGEFVFGVFNEVEGKGGDGAALVGLVKEANKDIRPSFLQQTNFRALRFDFIDKKFSLSSRSLISRTKDAVKVVDVRKMGSPVKHYISRVDTLRINGEQIRSNLPIYAMVDTGTTGMYISDTLFWDVFKQAKGFRNCQVDLKTEKGHNKPLFASRPDPNFLVFPVNIPWLDERKAHLLVLGLAFLEGSELTFDVDDGRIDIKTRGRV